MMEDWCMGLLEGGRTIWGEIFPLDEAKTPQPWRSITHASLLSAA
jgi:hypothetical protein